MRSWTGTARGLVGASHPGPTGVVTVLAAAFAVGVGAGAGSITVITTAVLTGQLSVGWSNDWLDARRDTAVARRDKPVVTGAVSVVLLRRAAVLAALVCVVLSLATGWFAGLIHLAAVASAWTYNLGLKSTMFSWLPYAVSFALLPAFVVFAAGTGQVPAWWSLVASGLLGVGAHIANTLPDLDDDRATGVRGLPHRIGAGSARLLAPLVLMLATAVVVFAPPAAPGPVQWTGAGLAVVLAVGAGLITRTRTRSRMPFTLSMAVAAVCVVLLVLAGAQVALPA